MAAGIQELAKLLQQRRPWIGPIELDASIEESHSGESAITDNPVEALPGLPGVVSDHVVLLPRVLTMTVVAFRQPDRLIGTSSLLTPSRHLRIWRKLRDLWQRRELLTVVTSLELYTSMVIRSLGTVRRNATTGQLEIAVTLRQILFAAVPGVTELSEAATELAAAEQDVGAQATQTRALGELATLL